MNPRPWLALAGIYGFLAVALGAFGAHALRARLDADHLAIWRTAVEYHLTHALALFGVAILLRDAPSTLFNAAAACFALGVLVFSGSLYALALGGTRMLGAVTPAGGLLLLGGWGLLVAGAVLRR